MKIHPTNQFLRDAIQALIDEADIQRCENTALRTLLRDFGLTEEQIQTRIAESGVVPQLYEERNTLLRKIGEGLRAQIDAADLEEALRKFDGTGSLQ